MKIRHDPIENECWTQRYFWCAPDLYGMNIFPRRYHFRHTQIKNIRRNTRCLKLLYFFVERLSILDICGAKIARRGSVTTKLMKDGGPGFWKGFSFKSRVFARILCMNWGRLISKCIFKTLEDDWSSDIFFFFFLLLLSWFLEEVPGINNF